MSTYKRMWNVIKGKIYLYNIVMVKEKENNATFAKTIEGLAAS